REPMALRPRRRQLADLGQRGAAIDLRLARSEQVERRPVEHEDRQSLVFVAGFGQGHSEKAAGFAPYSRWGVLRKHPSPCGVYWGRYGGYGPSVPGAPVQG